METREAMRALPRRGFARGRCGDVVALLCAGMLALAAGACSATADPVPATHNAELAYLVAVNDAGPQVDPTLVLLLMLEYMESSRHQAGIAHLERLLERYKAQIGPEQRAVYLAALGVVRADHAEEVPLFDRIGWVDDSIALLEEAKRITGGEEFVIRWAAGVVYSQLPGFFDMEQTALDDLGWCLDHPAAAPHAGWLREVHRRLAKLYEALEQPELMARHLAASGYPDIDYPISLTTPMAANGETGGTFHPRRLERVRPGRIYTVTGFEFTEFHFVVSADGRELIAIDAGTRADSMEAAERFLRELVPGLPPLTTVFVTHAHWDHVGGQGYVRSAYPAARFYARDNYRAELEGIGRIRVPFTYFFGSRFQMAPVLDFTPDVAVSGRETVTVGGSRFELIPVDGGETADALFVFMPDERVLFAGDFIMPYLGGPFVEEGSLPGLLGAIETARALEPELVLHGHEPLTRVFGPLQTLRGLETALSWLDAEVARALREGTTRPELHQRNLIPPTVLQDPSVQLPYLVMREHVIDRLYDQAVGYWEGDLTGMDHLSHAELGAVLARYLDVGPGELADAVREMVAAGDAVAAARLADWYAAYLPDNPQVQAARRRAYLQLAAKYQELDAFKFLIYTERAGAPTVQLSLPDTGR